MSDNIWYLKDFPFVTTFGVPGALNPVAVPLTKCVEWWYRIRYWAVSGSFTVTDSSMPPQIFTVPTGTLVPAGYTRELDMVNSAGILTFTLNTGGTAPFVSMWLFDTTSTPLINDSGTYYPYLAIFGQCGGINFSTGSGRPNAMSATVDGISVVMSYDNAPTGTTVSTTGFTFTPVVWWPYASRFDGSPIWDTATGAQLQSITN